MAVYTSLDKKDIEDFLAQYNIGELKSFEGIAEGIENTNYLLVTSPSPACGGGSGRGSHLGKPEQVKAPSLTLPREGAGEGTKFILTLFEKRVKIDDLPYFVTLMEWWHSRGIMCPQPIKMKDGRALAALKEKPALVVSFLEGSGVTKITLDHVSQLGKLVAQMHIAGMDFPHHRANALLVKGWEGIIDKIIDRVDEIDPGLRALINEEFNYLSEHWPDSLPSGPIHADLFPDNVFFSTSPSPLVGEGGERGNAQHKQYGTLLKQPPLSNSPPRGGRGQKLSGVIDFYFACNDAWAYDLAICVNAWCFDERHRFVPDRAQALMHSYTGMRSLTPEEEASFPLLLRGAALRFLLTRAHDWLNRVDGALVTPKDPMEYVAKLRFFQSMRDGSAYAL